MGVMPPHRIRFRPVTRVPAPAAETADDRVASYLEDAAHYPGGHAAGLPVELRPRDPVLGAAVAGGGADEGDGPRALRRGLEARDDREHRGFDSRVVPRVTRW